MTDRGNRGEAVAPGRRGWFAASVLAMVVGLALGVATEVTAFHIRADDQNDNGIPDVCRGGANKLSFLGIRPSPTAGRFLYDYVLLAGDAAARSRLNRIVIAFNRAVVPSNITGAFDGAGAPLQSVLAGFGAGEATTKVAVGDLNAFTLAIFPKAATSLSVPFSIEATFSRVGLTSAAFGDGTTTGVTFCLSRLDDAVAGPMGIEGPAVTAPTVDAQSIIAASSTLTSPANSCPVDVARDAAGSIAAVTFTAQAIANGCDPAHILKVPITDVIIGGVQLHHAGDANAGNGLFILGSSDRCMRLFDTRTGTVFLVSTTGTARNGCTT